MPLRCNHRVQHFLEPPRSGIQRWIVIGPLSLQPSEFAKIAIVLMAANLMDDLNEGDEFNSVMIRAALYVVAPTLFLLFTQSDLGTTIIIFVGVYAVLWFGGAPGKLMLAIAGVAVLAVIAIVLFGSGYRQDRFVVYNPWNDGEGGRGNGYQTIHSFYAFAEGGLFGVGLGNSSEKYDYLPEAETDFVFSIIGEEFGMLGALVVIALFCCILFAGMRIASAAATPNERIVAGSVTIMLVFQAFLNMGCVIGLMPPRVTLPFVSAGGGSSLIASLAVSRHHHGRCATPITPPSTIDAARTCASCAQSTTIGSSVTYRWPWPADHTTRAPQSARRRNRVLRPGGDIMRMVAPAAAVPPAHQSGPRADVLRERGHGACSPARPAASKSASSRGVIPYKAFEAAGFNAIIRSVAEIRRRSNGIPEAARKSGFGVHPDCVR